MPAKGPTIFISQFYKQKLLSILESGAVSFSPTSVFFAHDYVQPAEAEFFGLGNLGFHIY